MDNNDYQKIMNYFPPVNPNIENVLYVLQSNDMKNVREHVNCVDSNKEFINQASLSRTYYHGKKRLEAQNKKKYWRFMIIGRRDD